MLKVSPQNLSKSVDNGEMCTTLRQTAMRTPWVISLSFSLKLVQKPYEQCRYIRSCRGQHIQVPRRIRWTCSVRALPECLSYMLFWACAGTVSVRTNVKPSLSLSFLVWISLVFIPCCLISMENFFLAYQSLIRKCV